MSGNAATGKSGGLVCAFSTVGHAFKLASPPGKANKLHEQEALM
ncbi:unnamed protein product [Caenorhabditis auriculariae]|uniref:Uncharacterized protein n=1 Tax=Caenorhabditis auriculariae TaxID=2777116 RepID=A0A8S1HRM0_9PELO|nr:unnamed protein product [Caenorhabditis auriculariae]